MPNQDGLLREHLENILMRYVKTEYHVANARPQRTLAYVTEDDKAGMMADDLVMVALADSEEKRQWTFDNLWYNIPLDKIADTPWMKAKYLLLHVNGEHKVGNICKIVRTNHDVWTKATLWHNDTKCSEYPEEPHYPLYFMIRIRKPEDIESELKGCIFDINKITKPFWGNPGMVFYLVKLKDLLDN